jgi:hypothetical protein
MPPPRLLPDNAIGVLQSLGLVFTNVVVKLTWIQIGCKEILLL